MKAKELKTSITMFVLVIVSITWFVFFIKLGGLFYIVAFFWIGICIFTSVIVVSTSNMVSHPARARDVQNRAKKPLTTQVIPHQTIRAPVKTTVIIQQNNYYILGTDTALPQQMHIYPVLESGSALKD